MAATILLDLKTSEVFSFTHGWNTEEASIRPADAWLQYVNCARDLLSDKSWEGRILAAVPLPHEQE